MKYGTIKPEVSLKVKVSTAHGRTHSWHFYVPGNKFEFFYKTSSAASSTDWMVNIQLNYNGTSKIPTGGVFKTYPTGGESKA